MLIQFFQSKMDYVLFFEGLSFVLLAAVCAIIGKERLQRLPWVWMGLFGLVHGVYDWLEMLSLNLGDWLPFLGLRLWVLAFSFVLLLEFGREGLARLETRVPGRWVYIPLLALIILGGAGGGSGTNAAARYALGFTGGVLASLTIIRASRPERTGVRVLSLFSFIMALFAVVSGVIVPASSFFPASVINQETFLSLTGVPIQLLRAILGILMAAAVWEYHRQVKWLVMPEVKGGARNKVFQLAAALMLVLIAGWLFTDAMGKSRDEEERQNILNQARLAVSALNPESVKGLTGTLADLENPEYLRLREQLMKMEKESPQFRWLYLMILRDWKIVFAVDSIPEGGFGHTNPGVAYNQPPQELFELFSSGKEEAVGPYTDEYGTFLSGFIGIPGPGTGKVLAVLGVDVNAGDFQRIVAKSRISAIMIVLFVAVLVTAFFVVRQRLWESSQIIANSEKRLVDAQAVAHLGSWTLYPRSGYISWSGEMARIFGLDPETAPASFQELRSFIHPDDWGMFETAVQKAVREGEGYELDLRVIRPDGTVRYTVSKAEVRRSNEGEVVQLTGTVQDARLMGTLLDVTERKLAEEAIREAQQKYADLVSNLEVGVYRMVHGAADVLEEVNPALVAMFEAESREELVARSIADFFADPEERKEVVARILRDGVLRDEELQFRTLRGRLFWGSFTAAVKEAKDGTICFDGTITDITERKRAVELIRELSLTDELTGLHNRRGFMTLAEQQIRVAERLKQGLVLLYADIDRMKWINDTLGHKEGDEALKAAADVLRRTLRSSDIIARIGGDEFVALAMETMEMSGDVIRFRLQDSLRAYNEEAAKEYELCLSIGVVWYDPEHPSTLEELLERGDREMYEEKQRKRVNRDA